MSFDLAKHIQHVADGGRQRLGIPTTMENEWDVHEDAYDVEDDGDYVYEGEEDDEDEEIDHQLDAEDAIERQEVEELQEEEEENGGDDEGGQSMRNLFRSALLSPHPSICC